MKINTNISPWQQTMAIHLALLAFGTDDRKLNEQKKRITKQYEWRAHRVDCIRCTCAFYFVHLHKNMFLKWNSWWSKNSNTKTSYKSLNRRTEMVHRVHNHFGMQHFKNSTRTQSHKTLFSTQTRKCKWINIFLPFSLHRSRFGASEASNRFRWIKYIHLKCK